MTASPVAVADGFQVTLAWASPATASTLVGAPGIGRGVTALDWVPALVPRALVAVTVKV